MSRRRESRQRASAASARPSACVLPPWSTRPRQQSSSWSPWASSSCSARPSPRERLSGSSCTQRPAGAPRARSENYVTPARPRPTAPRAPSSVRPRGRSVSLLTQAATREAQRHHRRHGWLVSQPSSPSSCDWLNACSARCRQRRRRRRCCRRRSARADASPCFVTAQPNVTTGTNGRYKPDKLLIFE